MFSFGHHPLENRYCQVFSIVVSLAEARENDPRNHTKSQQIIRFGSSDFVIVLYEIRKMLLLKDQLTTEPGERSPGELCVSLEA